RARSPRPPARPHHDRAPPRPARARTWALSQSALPLYAGLWEGQPPGPDECVLGADEKASSQARGRCRPGRPPGPGAGRRVEREYVRGGALAHLAVWDVRRGGAIGRGEAAPGNAAFG